MEELHRRPSYDEELKGILPEPHVEIEELKGIPPEPHVKGIHRRSMRERRPPKRLDYSILMSDTEWEDYALMSSEGWEPRLEGDGKRKQQVYGVLL
jgi:hypothetical protein